jgi:cytochrome P450
MRSDLGDYNSRIAPHRDDPFPAWAEARRIAPVFQCPAEDGFLVTRYADVVAVVGDPNRFSSADLLRRSGGYCPEAQRVLDQGYGPEDLRSVVASDPPRHAVIRRLIASAFTARRVADLERPVRQVADELVDGFAGDGCVDLVARFAYPLPLSVIMALLGIPAADGEAVKGWSDDRVALSWGNLSDEEQVACARSAVEFQRYLANLVDERRARPHDDFVSALVAATTDDGESLTTPELVGQLLSLVTAGHETTTALIATSMVLLLRHGHWSELCADPGLASAAVEETLRMEGPVKALARKATIDVDLAGTAIPAGSRLWAVFGAANRDESVFPEPDRFDLHRSHSSRPHLAFGWGSHFCIGAALARLEGRVALEVLSRRLPTLRLRPDHQLRYRANAVLRMLVDLPLVWDA